MSEDLIDKTIAGRYRVLEVIGQGGLTTVYKALDARLNRVVALKVLLPYFARDVEFERRFQHEANALARLRHPNIVQMYEYGEADGLAYLVVEYVGERSLADILAEGKPLDVDYAIEIVRQVGEALSYVHRMGIIHRDIKPSNILVSRDGRVLVSDFGLGKAAGAISLTEIGTIVGTPEYMSPEQAKGERLDARSDIYSLGLVLYELLTGRPSFSGETPWELLHETIYQAPPPLRRFNPTVSPAVERAVLKALAKKPNQRYQTVDELVAALVEASKAPAPSKRYAPRAPSLAPLSCAFVGLLGALLALTLVFGPILWNWARNQPVLAGLVALGALLMLLLGLITWSRLRAPFGPSPFIPETPVTEAPSPTESRPITSETMPYTESPVAATRMLGREPIAMAWLVVLNGPQRGHHLRLADSVTIGRDASRCDIVLADPTISVEHARIRLENSHFYIYDLASTNGTFVNGLQVTRQELRDRDEIRMGHLIMLFMRVASPEDLTVEAKRRLREFDSVWDQLTRSVRHD